MNASSAVDTEKFRLRRFVDHLIEMGEVDIHDEPVPLVGLAPIIEGTKKAVLFKAAGPERAEIVAKTGGSRQRLAAAFATTEEKLYDEYFRRLGEPQPLVEIRSREAPVHEIVIAESEVDLTRLPFHPQHAFDGSCYLSAAMDFTIDPATGRRNVGCRRLSLRNRYEAGTNVSSPSDLKRIYQACLARRQRLPVTFTLGAHPLDFVAATMRQGGDELELIARFRGEPAAVVKSLTNDILVPADAEMTLEGYLDERGYVEPEGPYGEYMGYYGTIHMDPVFHCTAITMRRDALHLTLLHGSAKVLDQTDSANILALRNEAEAMRILRATGHDPVAVSLRMRSGGANNLRLALRQRYPGEARAAIAALFGGIRILKHVWVFDEDIDIHDEGQVEWAVGTRFQAHEDIVLLEGMPGMTMDPSLQGRRTGAKAGFDCTKPFGRGGEVPLTASGVKVFQGPARFQSVEDALDGGPLFYADIVEAVGSLDGREVAATLDGLRQEGRLCRDRDGRYCLGAAPPGTTGIIGQLYHDPNAGL
ncbi:MAG TPA: UbiD family decarboxylase [Patescibacteria group bacterium]|nr:UbiD family decarboxylase [Patescibacteria group bacterium]